MWWNFVGRSHEEVVAFREEWQAQLDGGGYVDGRFGIPVGDRLPPIPAPPLPNARLQAAWNPRLTGNPCTPGPIFRR